MIQPGSISDEVLSSLDLFPSFATAAGLSDDLPEHDGQSLLSTLGGLASPQPRTLLWQTGAHAELGRKSWLAYREGPLIYLSSPKDGEFLFDLSKDPNETTNLKKELPEDLLRLIEAALFRARQLRKSSKD